MSSFKFPIQNNIANGFTYTEFMRKMFSWINNFLVPTLEKMQKDQLFEDSQGADGVFLGRYARGKRKQTPRGKGQKYDMVFTGTLRDSIKVIVRKDYIEFKANPKYPHGLTNATTTFKTLDWFGLTPDHLKELIEDYLLQNAIDITKKKILTGVW